MNIEATINSSDRNLNRHTGLVIGQYVADITGNETEGQSVTFHHTHSTETKQGTVTSIERPVTGDVIVHIEVA